MIRDYESGSGLKGALDSLIGERVVGALVVENTFVLFFKTGTAVNIRAEDFGRTVICPLNADDVKAYIKRLIRDTDKRQADLDAAIQVLGGRKSAYVDSSG